MSSSTAKTSVFYSSALMLLLLLSLVGLFLVALLPTRPPVSEEHFVWRKPVIGLALGTICVFGIFAVFFPNTCSRIFDFGKKEKNGSNFYGFKWAVSVSGNKSMALSGHHPACGRFSAHVFHVGDRVFCATCTGLLVGAVVVLGGVATYFFLNLQMVVPPFSLIWSGVIGVFLGLSQPLLLNFNRSSIRVFSSFLLPVGTYLILVGIDELTHSFYLDVFLVFLTVFWLVTRISISQWEHEKACSTCSSVLCSRGSLVKNRN